MIHRKGYVCIVILAPLSSTFIKSPFAKRVRRGDDSNLPSQSSEDSEPLYDMGDTESLFNEENTRPISDTDTEGEEQSMPAKEEYDDKD
jgi:hypothetical protein